MSAAALALAAALLIWPGAPRRVHLLRHNRGRRPRLLPVVLMAAATVVGTVPTNVAIAAGLAAGTAWLRLRRRSALRARRRDAEALQGALGVLVGELRIGAHPVSAFNAAADEVSGPVSDGMRAIAARGRLGADVAGGLGEVAAHSSLSAYWQRLAVCWGLAEQHGLSIAGLMRTAQLDIVERESFSVRLHAALAGARATAVVLAGLPVAGIAIGQLIGAEPLVFLWGGFGGWLLVLGVLLSCAGLLWADQIAGGVVK